MSSRTRYDVLKRALDVVAAAGLLLLLAPVLLVVGLAVRLALGPPVLFQQRRPGLGGAPFTLYKFRSMRRAPATDVDAVASDAERLTPLGIFLRRSSLDELPELWNVLRGEMSIVGPRPLLVAYLGRYNEEQARRHEVRPGITGWAQVNGRNALDWESRFAMDVWYVDNRSLALDLKILARTVAAVLSRHGVAAEGEATVAPFASGADKEDR